MRRKQAFKRGRVLAVVVAGFAGYLIGGWNGSVPRSSDLSAAQAVALRFPQDLDEASPLTVAFATSANAATRGNTQLALFSPLPMVQLASASASPATAPQAPVQRAAASPPSGPQATVQMASAEPTAPQPALAPAAKRVNEIKPAAVHNRNDRSGFILNDAQIASIKTRLHLTPDQEQMWPAVEAALRNIAYTRARDARRHGAPANTQLAAANADGVDVRDLKSAAIPLIMSFNAEQKDEVRNIAHVMGLDQLASQF